jgi:hypothetical protein
MVEWRTLTADDLTGAVERPNRAVESSAVATAEIRGRRSAGRTGKNPAEKIVLSGG